MGKQERRRPFACEEEVGENLEEKENQRGKYVFDSKYQTSAKWECKSGELSLAPQDGLHHEVVPMHGPVLETEKALGKQERGGPFA